MAEPQPPNATAIEPENPAPTSAEDRKAAAALSSLDSHADAPQKSEADQKALGEAMSRLEVAAGGGSGSKSTENAKEKDKVEKPKLMKVDAGDVNLLVRELELSKVKATELLRKYEGNVGEILTQYINSAVAL